MTRSRFVSVASLVLGLVGCAHPNDAFEDFGQRYKDKLPIEEPGTGGSGGGPAYDCENGVAPTAEQLTGPYYLVLSASIRPQSPVVFLADVTSDGSSFSMSVQPLKVDRKTPVGDPLDVGPFEFGDDGTFDAQFPKLTVNGEANPVSGSELVATAKFTGTFCGPDATFTCGTVSGNVEKPAALPLDGSTFTMTKLGSPDDIVPEETVINCNGKLAGPVPP